MKISCILTSFNRPVLVRQALQSLADQSHRDFELLVVDDSDKFDIEKVLKDFDLPDVKIAHFDVTPEDRRKKNRLSMNINAGLEVAAGDLVTALCDDDYYYPGWFANASDFFEARPDVTVGFGKVVCSRSLEMAWPEPREARWHEDGAVLWSKDVVTVPFFDHTQVIHRRLTPPVTWPEDIESLIAPDSVYFRALAERYPFHPIDAFAVVKRIHGKNLQQTFGEFMHAKEDGLRE